MSFFDVLITLLILAGLVQTGRLIKRAWGDLRKVSVRFEPTTKRRTPGEVNRELWRQKTALDEARTAAKEAATWPPRGTPLEVQITPELWAKWSGLGGVPVSTARHLPDPPSECEVGR